MDASAIFCNDPQYWDPHGMPQQRDFVMTLNIGWMINAAVKIL